MKKFMLLSLASTVISAGLGMTSCDTPKDEKGKLGAVLMNIGPISGWVPSDRGQGSELDLCKPSTCTSGSCAYNFEGQKAQH